MDKMKEYQKQPKRVFKTKTKQNISKPNEVRPVGHQCETLGKMKVL